MNMQGLEAYDVVGIGFGPSNLALAIALEEEAARVSDLPLTATFLERQPRFGWHRNMLLPQATMQISFLKDLTTLRNPASRYSFISFLHESGRLSRFINNQSFFPTRQEFHQYLEWAAAKLAARVSYGSEVTGIALAREADGSQWLRIEVRDTVTGGTRVVSARNVVISTGLVPRMPTGVVCDDRVWHSSEFLARFGEVDPRRLRHVAVVGAGQSAAEVTRFFHDALPHARVSAIIPSYGYSIADDTPFANQIFDPSAVDDYYFGTDLTREDFWRYHKNTNYGVVDSDIIRELYRRSYEEEVSGSKRLHFLNLTRVTEVKRVGEETRVLLHSRLEGPPELDVDVLVFATGYDPMDPTPLLGDLDRYCLRDDAGRLRIGRDYSVITTPDLECGIYLQGGTEHTHGLSSALLSNIAVRSGEILDSIARRTAAPPNGLCSSPMRPSPR